MDGVQFLPLGNALLVGRFQLDPEVGFHLFQSYNLQFQNKENGDVSEGHAHVLYIFPSERAIWARFGFVYVKIIQRLGEGYS